MKNYRTDIELERDDQPVVERDGHRPAEARKNERNRGLIIARVIHHIGGGIRWSYNRNLTYAFAIALGLHFAILGIYGLTRIGEEPPVTRAIAPLGPIVIDSNFVAIDMNVVKVLKAGGGGGDPLLDEPVGKSKAGDPNAQPKYVPKKPQNTDTKVFDPRSPNKVKPVEKPKPDKPVATTDKDTSKTLSSGAGNPGQHAEGKGTTDAGGSGGAGVGRGVGVGVGDGTGIGSRGWVRAPRGGRSPNLEASGQVVLQATVMPNGDVTNIRPVKTAHRSLVDDAVRRLSAAKARPLPEDVPQVAQTVKIPFTYNIE